ncbi:MAG: enoyl-CoA hydratase-related protein [Syntrophales bacterium]
MAYRTLQVEIRNGIGIVWMNRPKEFNSLTEAMIAEMTEAMTGLDENPQVRIVVLAGAGESFCSGADIDRTERLAEGAPGRNRADALAFATLLNTIDSLKKPTVARIHGPVSCDGVGLVAACDIAVAEHGAEFCLADVRMGLIPAVVAPYVVRAMGERAARRYLFTGEPFTAAEAYRTGLINDLTPPGEIDAWINDLLGHLIQGGPEAQVQAKQWIRTAAAAPVTADLITASAERFASVRGSAEGREGIRAFLKKRTPAWLKGPQKRAAGKKAPAKAKAKRAK